MSQSLTIRVPDELWSAIEGYGLENYPNGESFDKTKTAIALFKMGLGIPPEIESNSLPDIVRRDEMQAALTALRSELVEIFQQNADRQAERLANQSADMTSHHRADMQALEQADESHEQQILSLETENGDQPMLDQSDATDVINPLKGVKSASLSRQFGVTSPTVSRWATGRRKLPKEVSDTWEYNPALKLWFPKQP
jgi:hypothetical protein